MSRRSGTDQKANNQSDGENREVSSPGESDHGIALDDQQLGKLVQGFKDSTLFPIVSVAAFTGARRNEVLALRWTDLDPAEETEKHGIRFKGPKKQSHKRTITMIAGVPDGLTVNLGLVKLPEGAFPNSSALADLSFVTPLRPRFVTKEFARKARKLGFKTLRLHDLRGTHETMLLDAGVPVHVVAARCGHDPATLLRSYAKRTRKADTSAASVIGNISRTILGK